MSATSSLEFFLRRLAPLALAGALVACSDGPVGFVPGGGGPDGGPSLLAAPAITKQPASLSVAAGAAATFEVTATGSGPLGYQWLRGGAPIAGATNAKLTLPAVATTDDKAKLSVVVSNTAGSATSADALLDVTTSIPSDPAYPTLCTGPKSTGWCWVTPVAGTKATFVDASNGLLLNGPLIFRTTDGGVHWFLATITATNIALVRDIHYASPTVAVAVGDAPGNAAITLRSTDAGATWSTVVSGVPDTLFGVSFGSAQVGAAVGVGGEIQYTVDGGQTWALAASGTTALLYSVAFGSATVGVAVGGLGTIVRTTDGGMTWTPVATTGNQYDSVKFASATTAFAVSGDGIRRSDDAGLTWTLIAGTTGMHDIDFGDPQHAVATGPGASSVHTSDGGATWTTLVGAQSNLKAVAFAGKSTVVVLGEAIQRSLDAGKTWGPTSPIALVALPPINALRYADPLVAVAVGGDSSAPLITRTTDGGATWTGVGPPTNDVLVGVDFASPTIGAAVGAGVILRTVDAGVTWTVVSSVQSRRLFGVRFASPKVGVAVGRQGLVLRTDDAGATWTPSASLGSASLTAVTFGSATTGIIGDEGGGILRTTDAGLTWSPVAAAGTGSTVASIDFADASAVVAVGSYSNIRRSADGGVTWATVVAADLFAPGGNAVRFASPTLGYIVGDRGVIRRTVDGGVTWTEAFPRFTVAFRGLDFSGPKNGLIGGQFSNILRTTTAGQ